MLKLTITQFWKDTSVVLDRIKRGQSIYITRRGKLVAKMIPAAGSKQVPPWKRQVRRIVVPNAPLSKAMSQKWRAD